MCMWGIPESRKAVFPPRQQPRFLVPKCKERSQRHIHHCALDGEDLKQFHLVIDRIVGERKMLYRCSSRRSGW